VAYLCLASQWSTTYSKNALLSDLLHLLENTFDRKRIFANHNPNS